MDLIRRAEPAASAATARVSTTPGPGARLLDPAFLAKMERLSLLVRRVHRSGARGERRSPTLGRGLEFADYRSYQAGDDFRYIDWHIFSRLERLFVKLFSEEEDLTVHLLVDASRSMAWGAPAKLDYAIRVAAALGYIGLTNLDRVGAATFTDRADRTLAPARSRAAVFALFDFLAGAAARGRSDLAAAVRDYGMRTRRRGLLVVISDLMVPEGVEPGLLAARYYGFEPFLVHLLAEEEIAPVVAGDLRLVDSETGTAVEVTADAAALAAYARARDRYFDDVQQACRRHRVEYVRATTAVPFDDLILRYLRIGGLIA